MNRFIQTVIIVVVFLLFIVDPLHILPQYLNEMYGDILHPNSLIFISIIAILFYSSVGKTDKELDIKSIKNTTELIENYLENKIDLEEFIKKSINYKYLHKILSVIKDGGIEEDISLVIDKLTNKSVAKYIKIKDDYEYFATVMPIVGMIGTIAGLLIMFAIPDASTDFDKKFLGLSIALATTLYASFFTILFFKPKAKDTEVVILELELLKENLVISARQLFHKIDIFQLSQLMDNNEDSKEM
jgi:flagellar motor component MotA